MVAYYTVVQYVPDAVTDERMNIGVVVFGDGRIRSRFVENWERARQFGGHSIALLREFAQTVKAAESRPKLPDVAGGVVLTEEALHKMAGSWVNSIQLTEPRASLREPEAVLEDVAQRFLRQQEVTRRGFRDRRAAAGIAYRYIEEAMLQRMGSKALELLKKQQPLQGELDSHKFDVSIVNGKPLLAAHGLSFEGPESVNRGKDVKATAWAVDDVRGKNPDLPIAIIALPPKTGTSKQFEHAVEVFRGLQAAVVVEEKVEGWASQVAERVAMGAA